MAPTQSSWITISRGGVVSSDGSRTDNTVVSLRGEHDAFTVDALHRAVTRAAALDDRDLVIDLSGVEFMGVAVVGAIVRARKLLRSQSRSLVLRSPSSSARRVLHLCGLSHLVDPRLVDAAPAAGPAAALGTWVEVPASDRVDRRSHEPSPEPARTIARAADPEASMADRGRP